MNDQSKMHRWKVDAGQIEQCNLETRLDPRMQWWKFSSLKEHSFNFYALREWFSFCTVIYEDLADLNS